MRYLFFCLLIVSLIVPCVGCGGGRPDPRDNPDFNDDPDPAAATTGMLGEDTGPGAAETGPGAAEQ